MEQIINVVLLKNEIKMFNRYFDLDATFFF